MTDDELAALFDTALEALREKQSALEGDTPFSSYGRFVVDLQEGVLTFFDKEAPKVEARILPVGTHAPAQRSFKWSWANQGLPVAVREMASRLKQLQGLTGLDIFSQEVVACDESRVLELVAMAAQHLSALGVYRMANGPIRVYVLITGIKHWA
jgi:hypothetical protein